METLGCGRARTEYTATVVLDAVFWLQSMSTFPVRLDRSITLTTSFGWSRSSSWATAWANGLVCA